MSTTSTLDPDGPAGAELLAAPLPSWTADQLAQLADDAFGLRGEVTPLDCERDAKISIGQGDRAFVLRVANRVEGESGVSFQVGALRHIAAADPEVAVPRVRPALDGSDYVVVDRDGQRAVAHVVDFLAGEPLGTQALNATDLRAIGETAARVDKALRGFFHPAAGREMPWDLQHARRLRALVSLVENPSHAELAESALDRFATTVAPRLPGLRAQVIHGDMTAANLLPQTRGRLASVIDFCDTTHSALLFEVATVVAGVLRLPDFGIEAARAVLEGYEAITPLETDERNLLDDCVAARLAATVLVSAWRRRIRPERAPRTAFNDDGCWRALGQLAAGDRVESSADLVARRIRAFGPAARGLFYSRLLHPQRAEGVWIEDADGRRVLDAYNNVPVVGHCHPHVVDAVVRQFRRQNTNSRYLYAPAVTLVERLLGTLPDEIDTVLLVNSGSEANDLAWRFVTGATGRDGALVSARAYHGVTAALDDLSPQKWRRGRSVAHVETLPPPSTPAATLDAVEPALERLAQRGHPVAALMLDPGWTSDGIFPDRDVMSALVAAVRAAGGLIVVDEVQTGFARFGPSLWGLEWAGVVPDVVTMGKPMGGGYPVAAVALRRDLAEAFITRREPVFSTFGGNPAACAAALAVLEVIESEQLATHAADVGAYMLAGARRLADDHRVVRAVRGAGSLAGIELAGDSAGIVVDRMREAGVLIGRTGPEGEVLKIRPPLPFTRSNADQLLETLDSVLDGLGDV